MGNGRPLSGSGPGRPRILFLITLAETGGAQSYLAALLPDVARRLETTVAAWGPGPLAEATRAAGAEYVPLRHVRRPLHPVRDALGLLELVRLIRRVRPHVVHANSSKAGMLGRLAARICGVPVVVFTVHGWAFKAHHGLAARVYLLADRLARPLTTAIVCVAESELRAGLAARTCKRGRTVVIRNAVELPPPAAGEPEPGPPLVLSVGRLKEPKDFVTLVRALALLEPGSFRARVLGDGPDRAAVADEVRAHGLGGAVELAGERRDVRAQLALAAVFALASRSEGMPISILEAMAAGLPVVASAVGGVQEAVADGETGLLVPPGDPEALAAALRGLLADAGLRARLGAAGRRRAEEEFSLDRFRSAHLELYRRELAARGMPLPAP